jgi:hypothetical protein
VGFFVVGHEDTGEYFFVINNHSQSIGVFISVLIKFCFFWPLLPCGSKNGAWRQRFLGQV